MATKPRILVVDDEKPNCDLFFEVLTAEELYAVDVAYNGIEALEMAVVTPYDLIISDITMPQLDGLSFLRRVKEKNRDVEVIMISGVGTIDSAIESFKSHAFDFLTKPVEIDKLLSTVEKALAKRELGETIKRLRSKLPHDHDHPELYRGAVTLNGSGEVIDVDKRIAPRFTVEGGAALTPMADIPELDFLAVDLKATLDTGEPVLRRWAVLGLRENLKILCYNTQKLSGNPNEGPAVIATVTDVSRLKRQEREKRDRERLSALGEMTSVVLLKVSSCLENIKAHGAAIMSDIATLNSGMRPNISDIVGNSEHNNKSVVANLGQIRSLLSTLEDFGRQFVPQYSTIDLNAVLKKVVVSAQRELPESITMTLDLAENLAPLNGSEKDMKQVLTSMIENAIHAVQGRGEILIHTSSQNELITLCIADDGIGILWEHQERIFDAFFSNWSDESAKGLGLALARKIVEDHDGVITLESQKDQGSVFTLTLPSAD